jgi:hypothetical protein
LLPEWGDEQVAAMGLRPDRRAVGDDGVGEDPAHDGPPRAVDHIGRVSGNVGGVDAASQANEFASDDAIMNGGGREVLGEDDRVIHGFLRLYRRN